MAEERFELAAYQITAHSLYASSETWLNAKGSVSAMGGRGRGGSGTLLCAEQREMLSVLKQ